VVDNGPLAAGGYGPFDGSGRALVLHLKSGGGGLTGTTADYGRFCEMLRRGGELDGVRILGPRTLEMMHMNHLKDGKDLTQLALGTFSETANEGVGFGLGHHGSQ
jgi:CubicO group peptidase (beta-lactamase class C family)